MSVSQQKTNNNPYDLKAPITNYYINTSQEVIQITEDKLRLCLTRYIQQLKNKGTWIAPIGIILATFTTIVTSTFHDYLGIEATTFKAIYIIITAMCFIWFL